MKPDVGHLVRVREHSALARDVAGFDGPISRAWQNCGIVIATRGIEVQVLLPGEVFSWVRRDNVEVIDGTR
jgi:hypothetical protein